MKLKNLFYLLLAAPLAFAACNETPEPEPQPKPEPEVEEPKLTLSSDATMEFEAAGGEGVITYTLENAKEGTELTATCEAKWVLNLTAGETVTFSVAENETEEARETKVVVAYGELSFEVAVKQAAKQAETPKAPVFELVSEETMEFGQEQTLGTIEFKLENPVAGVEVEAKTNASWISNVTVKENTIEFVVAANDGAAREAKITATYGMLEFKVTVKQAEYVAPAPVLEITSTPEAFDAEGGEGVLAYVLENAVEGVELQATADVEWITITSAADGVVAFTVAANETEAVREGVITVAYGEISQDIKIKQYFEGYNPALEYSVFSIVEVWASMKNDGKQWDVTFVEHDTNLGDMQTRISFSLAEANTQRVSDGTYTVENGGILVNTANENGYSSYRTNASLATDITAAEFTVATDTDAKVITINGTFQAGNAVVTLNFNGEMRGMDLGEAVTGAINHTEWASVVKNWHENKELLFTATSADGSLKAVFDFYDYDSAKSLAEGAYPVSAYYDGIGAHLRASSYFTYNNVESQLAEGTATVEHIAGGYKITYNVIDKLGRQFTGVIEGPIEGATNPA